MSGYHPTNQIVLQILTLLEAAAPLSKEEIIARMLGLIKPEVAIQARRRELARSRQRRPYAGTGPAAVKTLTQELYTGVRHLVGWELYGMRTPPTPDARGTGLILSGRHGFTLTERGRAKLSVERRKLALKALTVLGTGREGPQTETHGTEAPGRRGRASPAARQ